MGLTVNWKLGQSLLGELVASFVFGFAVYSSIISSTEMAPSVKPLVVGLTVGFSGIAIIYAFSDITIAHFNPAITFASMVFGKLELVKGFGYIFCQMLGFMLASAMVLACFPGDNSEILDMIRPGKANDNVSTGNLIAMEIVLTGILTFIAFSVAINAFVRAKYQQSEAEQLLPSNIEDERSDKTILAPLVIGFSLGFLALLGFGSSGGVFNPGLIWGSVIYGSKWNLTWAYWVAEFGGGLLGAALQVAVLSRIY